MTLRAIIIAVVLSVISVFWMHQASLVQAPGIIYAPIYVLSVPPVPAIFCLLLLVAVAPLSLKFFRKALSKQELLFVYMVLVITIPPVTFGLVELLFPYVTAGVYFAAPNNNYLEVAQAAPQWFYPHDSEVIRTMYEGSDDGTVPWGPWLYPAIVWTIFIALTFSTCLCLITLFHKQWSEHERLRFPLLLIPLSVVEKQAPGSTVPFFRNPLVWIAIVIVFVDHILNVMHAYNPAVMALTDRSYPFRHILTEWPWTQYRHLAFFHRPQVIGLAYFVPLDILFSGWLFHLMKPTLRLLSDVFGLTAAPGFPFRDAQSAGGYAAMALILFWIGRREIGRIIRKAVTGDPTIDDTQVPMSHRYALFGAVAGIIALLAWTCQLGVPVAYAAVFLLIFFSSALVFARIRAEAGVPTMWGPAPTFREAVFHIFGTHKLVRGGDFRGLSVLSVYNWMGRGVLAQMTAYHTENERLAEDAKLGPRIMPPVMVVAFVFGCILAYYFVLGAYYKYGATVLHGGTAMGGYNIDMATRQWHAASSIVDQSGGTDINQVIGMLAGALLTIGMVALRWRWLQCPLHPIGYVSCIWYGYALWWPFMVAWIIKLIVHRLGGARLYRQLMPFFLGLAFGDLLAGGISWIIMAIFGPDILGGYMVQFG